MKNRLISIQSLNTDVASLFLRMIVGGLFVYSGFLKLSNYHQILPKFGNIIGIGSELSFNLLIFAELVCGFFVLIGLLTRLSVIPIFISMVVAFFVAHAKDPFAAKQIAFVYLVLCPVIFILGSGKYSLDRLLQKRKPS